MLSINYIKKIVCLLSCLLVAPTFAETKVGIIVPLEHEAMTEIVNGFKTTLQQKYGKPITFKVANAQNDQNLQHSIIQEMKDGHYDLIVPIATQTSEMTIGMIKDKPIVALAADINDQQRQKLTPCNVAVVDDEISPEQILSFVYKTSPNLKHLVLIHSATEKLIPEVTTAEKAAKLLGIDLKSITIQNLMDLQNVSRNLPANMQGIFILKDNLVASGIAQLAQIAQRKHVPLITSDEGSVEKGADFSLGVREAVIGEDGAELALQILNGKNACSLPITKMHRLYVFVNEKVMADNKKLLEAIIENANAMDYPVQYV